VDLHSFSPIIFIWIGVKIFRTTWKALNEQEARRGSAARWIPARESRAMVAIWAKK